MRVHWVLAAAALVAAPVAGASAGCASVLGIPDDKPSFCAQPANQGHAYCEDFDVGDPSARWTYAEMINGAALGIAPSDRSPPNLLDMRVPPQPDGGSAIAGFDKEFDDATFVGLHIEADVRFVTAGGAIATNGGFLLITDKSGGCVALGLGMGAGPNPVAGIGALVFDQALACTLVAGNGGLGAAGGPPNQTFLTVAPQPNTWVHLVVIVAPDDKGLPGSGTLTFNIVGQPGSVPPVHLPAGTLNPSGVPLVGFAAQINGPSGPFEVQYDNITIDLRPN